MKRGIIKTLAQLAHTEETVVSSRSREIAKTMHGNRCPVCKRGSCYYWVRDESRKGHIG
jgi:hypothetical protein